MLRNAIFLLLTITAPGLHAQSLPKNFTDLLSRADMVFEMPDSFTIAPVIEQRHHMYDYAIQYPDSGFEVRFLVVPAQQAWHYYDSVQAVHGKTDVNLNPDSTYLSLYETMILNTSGGDMPVINNFDTAAVKSEFGANWGGIVFIHCGRGFTQAYKYCMLVALHKSRAGDAFVFFLANNQNGFKNLMPLALHALRFNNF